MINNNDGTYTYLVIPNKYGCVYNKLLTKLSDLGIDLLQDCSANCNSDNKILITCWYMFQAACAAYSLNEEKKSDLIINYIDKQLDLGCPYQENYKVPSISNFSLNIFDFDTGSTVAISEATFDIDNLSSVVENSLKIIDVNTGNTIAQGLSIISPSTFTPVNVTLEVGKSYSWKAQITGTDGKTYESDTYTVSNIKRNVIYYGSSNSTPQAFQAMSIDNILGLSGIQTKTIVGNIQQQFSTNQLNIISYLVVPYELIDLIKAEYGTTLITTLFDKSNPNSGTYFTTNPGGTVNGIKYAVYFNYNPSGAFDDDIRITVKNK